MADVQQLAAVAFHHFSTKAYDDALATLEKLKHLKDSDPRIRHNIAVVQYYRDGCAHPQQLLESLTEGQLKNDARDSGTFFSIYKLVAVIARLTLPKKQNQTSLPMVRLKPKELSQPWTRTTAVLLLCRAPTYPTTRH